MKSKSLRARHCANVFQRKALALAVGGTIALAFGGSAYAQAVNGTIQGTVPVAPNESIQITGGAGYNRTITVGPSGQYSVTLPVGTYTVSLLQNGNVVQSQTDVAPVAAGAVTVNFATTAQNAQTLSAVNVSASAIPAIDVTTTNQVTTITQKQLQQLPLGRSAEDIAMLAPGVQPGSAVRASGSCCNCLEVIVVTWLVVVTSIGGVVLAVTWIALRLTAFAGPPAADAKSTATAPAATGETSVRLCTTLPSCSSDTV